MLERCPEFEAWRTALAVEAETAERRVLGLLLERLADAPDRALPYAERVCAMDPDDTAALRRVEALRVAWTATGTGPLLVRAGHWMSHLGHDAESLVRAHWIRELSQGATLIRHDRRCKGLSD